MKDLLKDLVGVLEKYGHNIEIDSAMIEFRERGEILFVCRDLNREDWEKRRQIEFLDNIRGL